LRRQSKNIHTGDIDLVVLVNEKLSGDSLLLMSAAGWDVRVMATLAVLSPKSYYTYTFDKMYLWYMTDYEMVIFMDADFLCIGNPDNAFNVNITKKHNIAAVGDTNDDYFQTAFLVVHPNREAFDDLVEEYKHGAFNYNQWRARDGILLRNCFKGQHEDLAVEPDGHFLHHYYGFFKPWFNKDKPPRRSQNPLPFGKMYSRWWEAYEELHYQHFVSLPHKGKYGGKKVKAPRAPEKYFWVQRNSDFEYLRLTYRAWAEENNFTIPSLEVIVGEAGKSCEDVCHVTLGKSCREDALRFSSVNSCEPWALHKTTCSKCMRHVMAAEQPVMYDDAPRAFEKGKVCSMHPLWDASDLPKCDKKPLPDKFRVCPCVDKAHLETTPTLRY